MHDFLGFYKQIERS